MGKKKSGIRKGASFRGHRFGVVPNVKLNLRSLEKCSVLTSLQHELVQEALNKCTKECKELDGQGKEVEVFKVFASEKHQERLRVLLAKPFNEAKVDGKGNSWEKPKPLSEEEIKEMKKKAIENKKSISKKDLKKGNKDDTKS